MKRREPNRRDEVYIRRLRAKIGQPFGRLSLETIRGAGYLLRPD